MSNIEHPRGLNDFIIMQGFVKSSSIITPSKRAIEIILVGVKYPSDYRLSVDDAEFGGKRLIINGSTQYFEDGKLRYFYCKKSQVACAIDPPKDFSEYKVVDAEFRVE